MDGYTLGLDKWAREGPPEGIFLAPVPHAPPHEPIDHPPRPDERGHSEPVKITDPWKVKHVCRPEVPCHCQGKDKTKHRYHNQECEPYGIQYTQRDATIVGIAKVPPCGSELAGKPFTNAKTETPRQQQQPPQRLPRPMT